MSDLLDTDWFVWGLGLIIGFQALVVMLGELLYRADRRSLPITPILRTARNAVLPLLVIYVFVVKVLEEPPETIAVRVITTALWLSVLYSGLLLLNVLVFQQAPEGTWRHRAPSLFQDLLRMLLVAVGAAIVLAVVWEQDLGGLIAALGVGSIVLGLALQETLGNLMAGIALLFEKPFTIGDWIEVGDDQGEVVEINWRSVHVRTRERNLLVFPNSVLGRETIVNYARPTKLQTLRLSFGFALEDPPNLVKSTMVSVARDMEYVLDDPAPRALLREVEDDRLRYEAFLFIDEPRMIPQIVDLYTSRVWYASQRAGLRLPLPAAHEYQIHAPVPESVVASVDVVEVLSGAQGFEVLDASRIEALAARATVLHFGDGEAVITEGEMADGIHVIVSGEICARLVGADDTVTEATIGVGEAIGITSLARQEPSEVTLSAAGDTTTIRVDHEAVDAALRADPHLAQQFAKIVEIRRDTMYKALALLADGGEREDVVLPVMFRRPQSEPDESQESEG